jgi:hypothetical protein
MLGKIPWITEADIWKTLPKTSRIPTGGWRGWGAVPSHSYPAPSTLPNGYWQGMGMVPSVYDLGCQEAKTFSGFGQTAAPALTPMQLRLQAAAARDAGNLNLANMLEAQAKKTEEQQASAATTAAWTGAIQAIAQAGTSAYTAHQTAQIQEAAIRAGIPISTFQPTAAGTMTPPATTTAAAKSKTLLYVGAAVGIGLVAMLALKR